MCIEMDIFNFSSRDSVCVLGEEIVDWMSFSFLVLKVVIIFLIRRLCLKFILFISVLENGIWCFV